MSSSTSIIYGFGFNVNDNDPDFTAISTFLKLHQESVMELCGINVENLTVDEIKKNFEHTQCDTTGHESIYSLVSNIMSHETGINFQYEFGGPGSEPAILFAEGLPWVYNEVERKLTSESLVEIMTPYMRHLGMFDCYPAHIKVEYFG